jgi:hypothetical protein
MQATAGRVAKVAVHCIRAVLVAVVDGDDVVVVGGGGHGLVAVVVIVTWRFI